MRMIALFVCYFLVACASTPPAAPSLSETAGTDPEKMWEPAIVDEPGESPLYGPNGEPRPVLQWISVDGTTYIPFFLGDPEGRIDPREQEHVARTLCHNLSDGYEVNHECDEVHVIDIAGRLPVLAYAVRELPADLHRCTVLSNAIASFRTREYHIPPLNDFVVARDYVCGCNPATGICILPNVVTNATGPPSM